MKKSLLCILILLNAFPLFAEDIGSSSADLGASTVNYLPIIFSGFYGGPNLVVTNGTGQPLTWASNTINPNGMADANFATLTIPISGYYEILIHPTGIADSAWIFPVSVNGVWSASLPNAVGGYIFYNGVSGGLTGSVSSIRFFNKGDQISFIAYSWSGGTTFYGAGIASIIIKKL